MKKISIDDLIKRNLDKEKIEEFEIKINSLDGVIKCRTLPRSEVLELIEQIEKSITKNPDDSKQARNFDNKIIYDCVVDPNLKDENLHKHYNIKAEPYEVVEKVFEMIEISEISKIIGEKLGMYSNNKSVELIKKQ